MAQDNSFDIVSKVDIQEVRNAIDQALKEIRQRFDLKDSHSEVTLGGRQGDSTGLGRRVQAGGGQGHSRPEAGEAGRLAEEPDLREGRAGRGPERAPEDQPAAGHSVGKGQGDRAPGQGLEKEGAGQHSGRYCENIQQGPRRAAVDHCACCGAKIWAWS